LSNKKLLSKGATNDSHTTVLGNAYLWVEADWFRERWNEDARGSRDPHQLFTCWFERRWLKLVDRSMAIGIFIFHILRYRAMSSAKFASEIKAVEKNTMIGVRVGDTDVLVANLNGKIVALDNKCTHMRCRVSTGSLDNGVAECPCHGSKFDLLTGEVKQGPATKPLKRYDVVIEGEKIMVRI